MSILLLGAISMPAETDEPGPFERLFHAMRRAMNEPQHKPARRVSHKQSSEPKNSTPNEGSNTPAAKSAGGPPPSDRNTRTTTRVAYKKANDQRYGTPVPDT